MACSCKKKLPVMVPVQPQKISEPKLLPEQKKQDSSSSVYVYYTYTTTTLPLDSCPYCAQKHLGTAIAFILQRDYLGVYQASGQLLLASYHLPQYPQLVQKLRKAARGLVDNNSNTNIEDIENLDKEIQACIDDPKPQQRSSVPDYRNSDYIDAIVHASAAYELLQQPYYEQMNKIYAIGQLCLAGMIMRKYTIVDGAKRIRQAWKLLQQAKTTQDKQYQLAVKVLQETIMARLQS